jgi:hypothetical protein
VRHAQVELLADGARDDQRQPTTRPAAAAKLGTCVIEEVSDDARPAPDNGVSIGLGEDLDELD